MKNVLVFTALLCSSLGYAQESDLKELKRAFDISNKERIQRINSYSQSNQIPILYENQNGITYCLVDVINGHPEYIKTMNSGAARTTGADKLGVGGDLGLDLDGSGIKIGIWDGGRVRSTHQDLAGRTSPGDGATVNNFHATHVAGTILSSGEFNSSARGMAINASAVTFDFNNDDAEIIDQVASDQSGIIFSNHSYGLIVGWDDGAWYGDPSISDQEDYLFGFYNGNARLWDDLAYSSPYYTILKSAGNDRGDSGSGPYPPDGPFDTIGPAGTAKNIMTVGAVNKVSNYTQASDVTMSSFSSWGPTDDGRIKPDFVAAGVGLMSTFESADDAYGSLSGTSMSTPNATGTLVLIQQLYKKLHGNQLMKSAALKGLVVHTIREAGSNPGPDYSFGWGLLDAVSAANHIVTENGVNNRIQELTLSNGDDFTLDFTPESGSKVTATICWTDPAGSSPSASLDPTDLMLVNDLDMSISNMSEEHLPWVLNPASPSAAATKGDNFRDNIEKIEFTASGESYTLQIDHKGTLSSPQTVHLILSYQDPDLETLYWVGGADTDLINPSNWALESGGDPISSFTAANSTWIFDNNSLSQASTILTIDEATTINKIVYLSDNDLTISFGSNQVDIVGDLSLNDNISFDGTGKLNFSGSSTISAPTSFASTDVTFDNAAGSWSVLGDFESSSLIHNSGTISFKDGTGVVDNVILSSGSSKSVNFENYILESGSINLDALSSFSSLNSEIKFPSGGTLQGDGNSLTSITTTGDFSVSGISTIQKLKSNGSLSVQSSLSVDQLTIVAGTDVIIGDAQTLLTGSYSSSGNSGNPISFSSSGKGFFGLYGRTKVCLDYIQVNNVDFVGDSKFTVGSNGSLTNSMNWFTDSCEDILFADFNSDYTCLNSLTTFENLSSGNVESSEWQFGDGNTSTNVNPTHTYLSEGEYAVTLTVSDGEIDDSYTTTITISENDLEQNEIFANSTSLFSINSGEAYQWFKNGEPIEGATSRSYIHQSQKGSYFVVVYGTTCNIVTDSYEILVTSVEKSQIKLYPNPNSGILNFQGIPAGTGFKLFDLSGNKVLDGSFLEDTSINISHLTSGIYIVSLEIPNGESFESKILLNNEN